MKKLNEYSRDDIINDDILNKINNGKIICELRDEDRLKVMQFIYEYIDNINSLNKDYYSPKTLIHFIDHMLNEYHLGHEYKHTIINYIMLKLEKYFNKEDFYNIDYTLELGNAMFGNSRGEYSLTRCIFQPIFHVFIDSVNKALHENKYNIDDVMEYYKDPDDVVYDGFENDVFVIRPYYWGDDEDKICLPNFEYKPKNITISWYKYPLRDSYINTMMSYGEFSNMLIDCIDAINPKK